MAADDIDLTTLDDDVSFFDVDLAFTDGFDFPSFQHHACLELFFDEVLVKSFFVIRNTHKNAIFVAIRRCSQKIAPYIFQYAASRFFVRALSGLEA